MRITLQKSQLFLIPILAICGIVSIIFFAPSIIASSKTLYTTKPNSSFIASPEMENAFQEHNKILESYKLHGKDIKKSVSKLKNKNSEKKLDLPVLMYHRINTLEGVPFQDKTEIGLRVSPAVFEKQMIYIKNKGYQTITTNEIYNYLENGETLPNKPILLTFDDGFMDNYTNALPILKKYKMVGDFAIITKVIGTEQYMGWNELKDMVASGMGISSHTQNHCYLAVNVDPKTATSGPFKDSPVNDKPNQECPQFTFGGQLNTGQILGELKNSKQILEENLKISVHGLVYPYGKYNHQVMQIAKDLGYLTAFTVEPQGKNYTLNLLGENAFKIPRIRMQGQQTGESGDFLI